MAIPGIAASVAGPGGAQLAVRAADAVLVLYNDVSQQWWSRQSGRRGHLALTEAQAIVAGAGNTSLPLAS